MIALLFLVFQAKAAIVCGDALMKSIVDGEEKVESTRLCVDDEQRLGSKARVQAIASFNCRDENGARPCLAYAKARDAFTTGAPVAPNGFDLCLRAGGEPQSIAFQMDKLGAGLWHTTDRCRFDLDYSYLDTKSFAGTGPFRPQTTSTSDADDPKNKR